MLAPCAADSTTNVVSTTTLVVRAKAGKSSTTSVGLLEPDALEPRVRRFTGASKAERRDQPSGPRRDTVWSRRVAQKTTPRHVEEKHAVPRDEPQRPDGCHQECRQKPGRDWRPSPAKEGLAASFVRDILQEEGMGDRRRGHLLQHQGNPDSYRLHCRTRRNAVVAELVSSLGESRNSTANEEHTEARPLTGIAIFQKRTKF